MQTFQQLPQKVKLNANKKVPSKSKNECYFIYTTPGEGEKPFMNVDCGRNG